MLDSLRDVCDQLQRNRSDRSQRRCEACRAEQAAKYSRRCMVQRLHRYTRPIPRSGRCRNLFIVLPRRMHRFRFGALLSMLVCEDAK